MKREAGFILITTVLMLSIVVLFSLTQSQLLQTQLKIFNARLQHEQKFRQLEWVANRIIIDKALYLRNPCTIDAVGANESIVLLKKNQGCTFTYVHKYYNFIIENLGFFPCLEIERQEVTFTSFQWRITVIAHDPKNEVVQIRISEAGTYQPCFKKSHPIKTGSISWRYLSA